MYAVDGCSHALLDQEHSEQCAVVGIGPDGAGRQVGRLEGETPGTAGVR